MVFQLENLTSCRSKKKNSKKTKKTQTSNQFIHMFPQSVVSFSWHQMASTKSVCPSGHLGGLLPWKPTQCPQPPSRQLQDHLFQKLCDCSKLRQTWLWISPLQCLVTWSIIIVIPASPISLWTASRSGSHHHHLTGEGTDPTLRSNRLSIKSHLANCQFPHWNPGLSKS